MNPAIPKWKQPRNCGDCGDIMPTSPSNCAFCTSCCHKRGICSRCKVRSKDMPGMSSCSACWASKQRENERNPKRLAKWQIRQMEQDKQSAVEVLAMYEKDLVHG